MSSKLSFISTIILFISISFSANADDLIGAKAADLAVSPTIEQMLTYAIQDEYLARAEYAHIIKKFDAGRPFTNIIRSEETHINMLKPLFEKYGYTIPQDTSENHIPSPASLKSAFETGVQAEIDNIAMYERFLKSQIPDDMRDTFERLKHASQNHLRAFKNGLGKYN